MGVTVNRNLKTLHEALRLTADAVKDAAVVADSVYRAQEKRLFDSQGGSGGEPWQELSKHYKAWKDRQFSGAEAEAKRVAAGRGRKLTGFALRAAVGSENKILQLTGDMKRAFSNEGGDHVAEGQILPSGARILLGAVGPDWYAAHARGDPPMPRRDPQQRTPEQDEEILAGVRRALIPHALRAARVLLQTGAPKSGGGGA